MGKATAGSSTWWGKRRSWKGIQQVPRNGMFTAPLRTEVGKKLAGCRKVVENRSVSSTLSGSWDSSRGHWTSWTRVWPSKALLNLIKSAELGSFKQNLGLPSVWSDSQKKNQHKKTIRRGRRLKSVRSCPGGCAPRYEFQLLHAWYVGWKAEGLCGRLCYNWRMNSPRHPGLWATPFSN